MRRTLLVSGILTLGLVAAVALSGDRGPAPVLGPAPAFAGDVLSVPAGETFVTSDGPNAYLWRHTGERIELVGQASRTFDGPEGQATWVWLPGVERRS